MIFFDKMGGKKGVEFFEQISNVFITSFSYRGVVSGYLNSSSLLIEYL